MVSNGKCRHCKQGQKQKQKNFQTRPNHKGSILEVTSPVFTEETFALVRLGLPVSNGKRAHKQRKPLSDIPLKLEKFRDKKNVVFENVWEDAVVNLLMRWTPGREVWPRDLAESKCCVLGHFTLTAPLFTQEYKWVPPNYQGSLMKC